MTVSIIIYLFKFILLIAAYQLLLENVYNLFKGKAEQYNCRSFAAASKWAVLPLPLYSNLPVSTISPNHFFLSYANQTKSFVRFSWQHCCCNMWAEKYLQAMKNTNPFWTQGTKINELLFWAHKEHGATCKGAGNHLVLLTAHRRTDNYVYCGQKCNTLKLYAKLLETRG